ncbi:hypothetical protein BLA24_00955 [Streptomyces cinnamoneus]|uniref:DUF5304 domain-containing protein n=1 Tax=Streptomyces cinnamoneus TaxID=53446 RepID=A0A2G1XQR6_STRCJ|nr:DUF5304 family protein [Streptomyces cinnamoneus]PHQ53531.1 hypothetical protein BLA24_00955 [Streptomyces cinnamoneus]PPT12836.1 hypothetical protein CYQ11_07965 [Streptomyces cinnamoneus]
MSEATEGPGQAPDPDAWERACAEDLAAERARRRAEYGHDSPPGSAAEELRKLVDAVAEKVSALHLPLAGAAAQEAVRHLVTQARTAVEPVIERNPEVFDHLASAGSELRAAYRAAVRRQEARWTRDEPPRAAREPREGDDGGADQGGTEHIDLD